MYSQVDRQDSFDRSSALDRLGQRLMPGQARRVGRGIGELTVLAGRVWITGHGPAEDRVLEPGERIVIEDAAAAVIETFDAREPARVAWRPRSALLQRLGVRMAERLRGAFGAALRPSFAALARRAASNASRAQGCMS